MMFGIFSQNKQYKPQNFYHSIQVSFDDNQTRFGFDVAFVEKIVENKPKRFAFIFTTQKETTERDFETENQLYIYDLGNFTQLTFRRRKMDQGL